MSFIKMYIENDAAHDIVMELGYVGAIEFKDLNPGTSAFQRKFAGEIKRCEEMQRKLRLFRGFVEKDGIPINPETYASQSLNDLEMQLNDRERELLETNKHFDELSRSRNELTEQRNVLEKCADIYHFAPLLKDSQENPRDPLLLMTEETSVGVGKVGHVSGIISAERAPVFERIVFRATRGNCFTSFIPLAEPLTDPRTGKQEYKTVFMTFYSGGVVGRKISRIAEGFQASVYSFPDSAGEREARLRELRQSIEEVQTVLLRTGQARHQLLGAVANSLVAQEATVGQELAIYHTLNLFDHTTGRKGMHAEGWCPTAMIGDVRYAIEKASQRSNVPRPVVNEFPAESVSDTPPTFYNTNKLTSGFQAIVDAYGVADYREYNPMPFSVITFPFLFAVMFGDLGHGFIMFLFSLFMLIRESHFKANPPGEIFGMCFGGRYVILLMSLFSMYTGLLYNDTFALAFNWFGTAYHPICDEAAESGCEKYHFSNYFMQDENPIFNSSAPVYPFGLDPIWKQSENELSYTNSLKMKLSIVLGVTQMGFGVILGGLNHLYFKNWISLFHEFIPQIIFLCSVFGYMTMIIFIKWATYYENTHCAPSILTTFIDMFLGGGMVTYAEDDCKPYSEFFPGQQPVQQVLLLLAFVSVPWMLFTKPFLLRAKHSQASTAYQQTQDVDMGPNGDLDPEFADGGAKHVHGTHEEFDFAEEFVHQVIHTIEYVLGTVSNTASYLRLWALSLAHAQLSTVFWEKVMVDNMAGGPVAIIIGFMVWVMCTVAVLMVMESLSAFLHALRLHWVEFQNKFYHGQGVKFAPFKFGTPSLE